MEYVYWMDYVRDGSIKTAAVLPGDGIEWTEQVTGTRYYMTRRDYDGSLKNIENELKDKTPQYIVNYLDKQGDMETIPFVLHDEDKPCTLREAARLYVLFAYLIYRPDNEKKEEFRKSAYDSFFLRDKNKYPLAWEALEIMVGKDGKPKEDVSIKILKGGAYKIKKYYLENNEIKDIRGASTLLTYVGEELIPKEISKRFINECVIYAGGGSVFCILPHWAEDGLWREMEMQFHEYTLSVNNVFCMEQVKLSDILCSYKDTIDKIEDKIDRRKRMKVYNSVCPETPFWENGCIYIGDELEVKLEADKTNETSCKLCRVRKARYKLKIDEKQEVCGSCLHKHFAGKSGKKGYFEEYGKFVNRELPKRPEMLDDVADKGGYIAVVYADGNNMGAIVHGIKRLDAMMYFSRRTSKAAKKAAYQALQEIYDGSFEGKFEIIALGGDDIFLIVPGANSIEFSIRMIELFNEEFRNLSLKGDGTYRATLSAGICIGKSKSPVRVMFDYAEKAMHDAKAVSRRDVEKGCDRGSLDYVILQSSIGDGRDEEREVKDTLLPYSLEIAKGMLELVKNMKKKENNIGKSNLFRVMQAFESVESVMEGKLFYCFDQARNDRRLEKMFRDYPVPRVKPDSGYFISEDGKLCSPWKDILNIWDFCGGDKNG